MNTWDIEYREYGESPSNLVAVGRFLGLQRDRKDGWLV